MPQIINDTKIDGVQDVTQLQVEGHTTQTQPLQTWQDSGGNVLARITNDGRLQEGNLGLGTPAALVEANDSITLPSTKPKRGWHSLGRVTGAITDAIAWVVHELELLGTGGTTGLQTGVRAKLTHNNTGNAVNAELRTGDFQAVNQSGASGTPVGKLTALHGAASNSSNAYLNKAIGIEATVTNDTSGTINEASAFEVAVPTNTGTINTVYGLRIPDLTQGGRNIAIQTGQGVVRLGDHEELKVVAGSPTGNPPVNFIKVYPKLNAGAPHLYAKDASGAEYDLTGSVPQADYFTTVMRDKPTRYYRLGETTGSAAYDASSSGQNGTYVNSPTLDMNGALINRAATFNGSTGFVSIPTSSLFSGASFTIELWARLAANAPATQDLFAVKNTYATDQTLVFRVNNGTNLLADFYNEALVVNNIVGTGAWYHLVTTYNSSTQGVTLYVNGVAVGNSTLGPLNSGATPNITIGCVDGIYNFSKADIDEVAVYNSVLSPTRILAHYTARNASNYDSVVLADAPKRYYRLDEPSGTTAVDSGSDAANGTYTGGVTLGTLVSGDSDTAVTFNGTNQYVSVPLLALENRSFSVEGWLKCALPASDMAILEAGQSAPTSNNLFTMKIWPSGDVGGEFWGNYLYAGNGAVSANTWTHVVFTYEYASDTACMYVNGTLKNSNSAGPLLPTLDHIYLARGSATLSFFAGSLDDVAIYATALSAAQVAAHYAARIVNRTRMEWPMPGTGKVLTSDAMGNASWQNPTSGAQSYPCQGRLTLTSGTPVTTADVTGATTLYFTPYNGDHIALYTGSAWANYTFTERSLSLSGLAANTNYDIFLYDNGGTLTLEATAWTNNTARATALVLQNGVYLKSGATTRHYLGTIRTTSTAGQTEDSQSRRFVYNQDHPVARKLWAGDTGTNSWTYSASAWRAANNNTANRVEVVIGNPGPLAVLNLGVRIGGSGTGAVESIGYDTTTNTSADIYANITNDGHVSTHMSHAPAIGYHYYQWVENARGNSITVFSYSSGAYQSGIVGSIAL